MVADQIQAGGATEQVAQDGVRDETGVKPVEKGAPLVDSYKYTRGSVKAESGLAHALRRLLDIVVSLSALVVGAPIMLTLVIMIKLDSPGPAIFKQIRMTRDRRKSYPDAISDAVKTIGDAFPDAERRKSQYAGRPFNFYKFRTMYVDAKERFPELYEYQYSEEQIRTIRFKVDDDPRITRVGRFLRKTSLDELPNFWNVLKGDMTLCGPRPEIPEMSPYYKGEQLKKFQVEAGLTGPAQIGGRGDLSFQDTVKLDTSYAVNRSFLGDIKILWLTVVAVVKGRGAV